ncbi:hypothetical protein BsWGS_11119 [Bradybaena similaris]
MLPRLPPHSRRACSNLYLKGCFAQQMGSEISRLPPHSRWTDNFQGYLHTVSGPSTSKTTSRQQMGSQLPRLPSINRWTCNQFTFKATFTQQVGWQPLYPKDYLHETGGHAVILLQKPPSHNKWAYILHSALKNISTPQVESTAVWCCGNR